MGKKLPLYLIIGMTILIHSFLSASESGTKTLTGILRKRTFEAPPIVQNPAFGWFLELDPSSEKYIRSLIESLSMEDRRNIANFEVGNHTVQLLIETDEQRSKYKELEGLLISITGKTENPPYLYSAIPCYQMHVNPCFNPKVLKDQSSNSQTKKSPKQLFPVHQNFDKPDYINLKTYEIDIDTLENTPLELSLEASEAPVSLKGKLVLRLCPGPPNYSSTEAGDYPSYIWFIQMNKASFQMALNTPIKGYGLSPRDILDFSNWFEIQICTNSAWDSFCCDNINREVEVEGILFHAHTAHHRAPFIMELKQMRIHRF